VEKDEVISEFGEVGGFEAAGAESGLRFREISFTDGGAFDDKGFGFGEREADVIEGGTDASRGDARNIGAIVGDAAAFGGAVEIVDFEI